MNNKGQTLVLFVLLLPIILLLAIFIVDTGKILLESNKLKSTTKLVIKAIYEDDIDLDASRLMFMENDINVDNLKITLENESVVVDNNYEIDSYFGNIIGIKSYAIKLKLIGYQENNKIRYKKG